MERNGLGWFFILFYIFENSGLLDVSGKKYVFIIILANIIINVICHVSNTTSLDEQLM